MGSVADGFAETFRDYVTDGLPGSGINPVSKAQARALGSLIEQYLSGVVAGTVSAGGAAKIVLDVTPETGTVGTGVKHTFRLPYGFLLSEVRASLTTAGGSATTVDITCKQTEAGTAASILSAALQVDAAATTSVGSAAPAAIATSELNDNAEIKIDVTADGGGAGLKVYLIGTWAAFGVGHIPYFVGVGSGSGGAGGHAASIPYPTGFTLEANDVAILTVFSQSIVGTLPTTINRPSGWNTILNPVGPSGGGRPDACAWFWRRLDGTETGSVAVTSTGGDADGLGGQMSIWRGCVENGDPFESALGASGNSSTMQGTSIVPLGPNRLAVNLYVNNLTDFSTPDTGWTSAYDNAVTAPSFGCMPSASVQQFPVALTTPVESRAIDFAHVATWSSCSLALVPATS